MKFEYLRDFVTAANTDEMQAAAQKLGISLSTLSKHITALELELGVELFTHVGRKVKLSAYGKILREYGARLLEVQDEFTHNLTAKAPPPARKLTLGLSPIQFREESRILLEAFGRDVPDVQVVLRDANNRDLPALVSQGQFDCAIVRTPAAVERLPDLVYLPFSTDEMVALLPADHPLAGEKFLTFGQLKGEKIVLRQERSTVTDLCRKGFLEAGVEKEFSYASHYGVYDMVKSGEAITFYLAQPTFPNSGPPLAVIPIRPALTTFVDILYRRGRLTSATLDFLDYALTYMIRHRGWDTQFRRGE